MATVSTRRVLQHRLRRHRLQPPNAGSALEAVRSVVAVRGWPADVAEHSVAARSTTHRPGALTAAVDGGVLVRSYAWRGGSWVFTPEDAATVLACRGASRVWTTKRFQRQTGSEIDDWEPIRRAITDVLADGPLTRTEITAALSGSAVFAGLHEGLAGAGSDTLYKPLHWWGDIAFGPDREGRTTFRSLAADPRWPGLPELDDAGPSAIRRYLTNYGPAAVDRLEYWLRDGLSVPKRLLTEWIAAMDDEITTVDVDGRPSLALREDLAALRSLSDVPSVVRLLPGHDPWVLGAGTADPTIVPPSRRAPVTNGSAVVILDGVVSGTWRLHRKQSSVVIELSWFEESGALPQALIDDEVNRWAQILTTEPDLIVTTS